MMHLQVRTPLLGALLALGLLAAGTARADKIAVVNMQLAIESTTEGKAAMAKLKAEADKKQKELEKQRDDLKKMDDDLAKQASILKPDALQKKQQELQQKLMQWQEAAMRTQRDLQDKEQKATQPIVDKLLKAINAIASRDHFTLVVRSEVVLWPQHTEMDITNEVIRKANEMGTQGK